MPTSRISTASVKYPLSRFTIHSFDGGTTRESELADPDVMSQIPWRDSETENRHTPYRGSSLPRGPFLGSRAVAQGLITRPRLAGRSCRRLLPGVYLRSDTPLDHLIWCEAALLAAPRGTPLGFWSALGLYCPSLLPTPDQPVDLVVPRRTTMRPNARLRIHRGVVSASEIRRYRGFPATSPARTGFDLARQPDFMEAVVCVDALLAARVTNIDEIAAYVSLGMPGSRRAVAALASCSPKSESPMETRARLILVRGGLPEPVCQYEIYEDGMLVARVDLAYPKYRIAIEYDGDHHRERTVFQRDAYRANRLRLLDWTVLRFTADDVLRHPLRMIAQVRTALAAAQRQ